MTAPNSMFSTALVIPAMRDAVKKLKPRELSRNPVMFVTASVATLLTLLLALGEEVLARRPGMRGIDRVVQARHFRGVGLQWPRL